MKCEMCEKETRRVYIKHHLSYDPEILVDLCRGCHNSLHWLAREVSKEKLDLLLLWINTYSKDWKKGAYRESQYYKSLTKEYMKKYGKDNREKLNAYNRKQYKKNINKEKVRGKKYHAKNRERVNIRHRKRYREVHAIKGAILW